jgi:hypothetical protein
MDGEVHINNTTSAMAIPGIGVILHFSGRGHQLVRGAKLEMNGSDFFFNIMAAEDEREVGMVVI